MNFKNSFFEQNEDTLIYSGWLLDQPYLAPDYDQCAAILDQGLIDEDMFGTIGWTANDEVECNERAADLQPRVSGYICSTAKDPKWTSKLPGPYDCPEDFVPFGSSCVKMIEEKQDFQTARKTCKNFNKDGKFKYAGLASVTDVQENLLLQALGFPEPDLKDPVWIGFTQSITQGPAWDDHHQVWYSNFGSIIGQGSFSRFVK